MALTINTNLSSLFAQQTLSANSSNLSNTIQRLSSGLRINNASDDPAGLGISQNMLATINGTNQGTANGNFGINLVQSAQGAMQVVLNDLQTMNTLAVQAANGTNSSQDYTTLNTQYQALLNEIGRVSQAMNFNGVNVLAGGSIAIQIGAGTSSINQISITLSNTSTGSAGLNISGTALTSSSLALQAIGSLSLAISSLTTGLSTIGADESDLMAAISSNNTYSSSLQAAKSTLVNADYAQESSNLAMYNILNQTDVAMLAQANSLPSLVLQLLRG